MDPRVGRLSTIEQCRSFEKNAENLGEIELAQQARLRLTQIKASEYGAKSDVELECLQAVFAYEETLFRKNGKRTAASRTWQMIKRVGILAAAERAVVRPVETQGFRNLIEMGLGRFAFEAVILRNPESFGPEAIRISRDRIAQLRGEGIDIEGD